MFSEVSVSPRGSASEMSQCLPPKGGLTLKGVYLQGGLTSSGGHCSGQYTSYWNAFLLLYSICVQIEETTPLSSKNQGWSVKKHGIKRATLSRPLLLPPTRYWIRHCFCLAYLIKQRDESQTVTLFHPITPNLERIYYCCCQALSEECLINAPKLRPKRRQ